MYFWPVLGAFTFPGFATIYPQHPLSHWYTLQFPSIIGLNLIDISLMSLIDTIDTVTQSTCATQC
jgi:hypothetical protein